MASSGLIHTSFLDRVSPVDVPSCPPIIVESGGLLACIVDPRLRALAKLWIGAYHAAGTIPPQSAIDPSLIPSTLPVIWILEQRTDDVYYRLAGEEIIQRFGRTSLRNVSLLTLWGAEHAAKVHTHVDLLFSEPRMERMTLVVNFASGARSMAERVSFPLSQDGKTITRVIGATAYELLRPAGASIRTPITESITRCPIPWPAPHHQGARAVNK